MADLPQGQKTGGQQEFKGRLGLNEKAFFEKGPVDGQGYHAQDGHRKKERPKAAGGEVTPPERNDSNKPDRGQDQADPQTPGSADGKTGEQSRGRPLENSSDRDRIDSPGYGSNEVVSQLKANNPPAQNLRQRVCLRIVGR